MLIIREHWAPLRVASGGSPEAKLTSNGLEEDSARSSKVEWSACWVDVAPFAQVVQVLDFVSAIKRNAGNYARF